MGRLRPGFRQGVTAHASLPIRAGQARTEGFTMAPGWIAVSTIAAFVIALAILNILEKGSID